MRDVLSWSLSLGRWANVQVRVHAFFLLLGVFVLHAASTGAWPLWYALSLMGILLASLLLHEAAHVLAARRCGGHADQILVWPLGGLYPASAPRDARAELLVAVAGPLVNLLVAAATLPALLILKKWSLWQLINPLLAPYQAVDPTSSWGNLPECLALVFWLNWLLFLVNLLPAFPLDGGRILHSALWLAIGQRSVSLGSVLVSQLTGILLLVAAWLVHDSAFGYAWAPLAILGVVLFFSARSEAMGAADSHRDDDPLGYDFSQGYTSLERDLDADPKTDLGPVGRWLEERREARHERQRQVEEDEERRVDDILARLHIAGLAGLSPEDRQILDRVSARYRNRQKR
jgi:stage IV sporulation protein FB